MTHYYYEKVTIVPRQIVKTISIAIFILGFIITLYTLLPIFLWQVYFAPAIAANSITAPIPQRTILNSSLVESMIAQAANSISGIDYTNAQNWFPAFSPEQNEHPRITTYTLSIPKLGIQNAQVSTIDNDLSKHLINYAGTAVPPENGNTVIFGHSTLPQLFNPKDYKKIFATVHNLKIGDLVTVNISDISYNYRIFNIRITDPQDSSVFEQNYDDSYLTLVTCTPPGTVWKRLILKSRLQKISDNQQSQI